MTPHAAQWLQQYLTHPARTGIEKDSQAIFFKSFWEKINDSLY
ncbi:tyrosine recombinase xerC domain protein [Chlamydia psittaci WS/RT/E30]|nr:tyrosine recombinase xerC domain protein [Chlamydia psittaci WS/RT/E30]